MKTLWVVERREGVFPAQVDLKRCLEKVTTELGLGAGGGLAVVVRVWSA